ncbi:MAG: ribbon-helix-helix protein, CopG family [Agriterribacter sp.]
MGAEIKSGKIKIEFALSESLKARVKAKAAKQKKSVSQYLRDLVQADVKIKGLKTPRI